MRCFTSYQQMNHKLVLELIQFIYNPFLPVELVEMGCENNDVTYQTA